MEVTVNCFLIVLLFLSEQLFTSIFFSRYFTLILSPVMSDDIYVVVSSSGSCSNGNISRGSVVVMVVKVVTRVEIIVITVVVVLAVVLIRIRITRIKVTNNKTKKQRQGDHSSHASSSPKPA